MKEKRPSGRNSPVSIVIASICICLYLAALVTTIARIYIHIERQRDIALNEFSYIADLASSAGVLGFMNEPFIGIIQESLAASKTLEGLIISGPNGEYPFEKNPGQSINMVNNSPRFKNRFDFSRQPLYMPLIIQNLRNVNIEARAASVDYIHINSILKQTLLIVLASLLLSFFTLLMQTLLDKSNDRQRNESSYNASIHEDEYKENYSYFEDKDFDNNPEVQTRTFVSRQAKGNMPAVKSQIKPIPEVYETEIHTQPKGLYSPRGNIGWEEYTVTRLDSELHRCASNEQDLVFLVMELKNSPVPDEHLYQNFADEAVAFFTMRDLIFEKGDNGISVILPNFDLETAIEKAGAFHERCLNKFGRVFKSKTDLCIGLSSRSGRLIDAKQLGFEASEALGKALSDSVSPIIAFKSDPEKYRAYIASRK